MIFRGTAREIALEPSRAVKRYLWKSQISSHVDLWAHFTLPNKSKFGTLKITVKFNSGKMIKKTEKAQVISEINT